MNVLLRKRVVLIADAIGIGHWVVATLVVILGQVTSIFQDYGIDYPGLEFIYRYIDMPVYSLISSFEPEFRSDMVVTMMIGQIVIISSSVLYAFVAYLTLRLLFLFSR